MTNIVMLYDMEILLCYTIQKGLDKFKRFLCSYPRGENFKQQNYLILITISAEHVKG